LEMMSCKWRKEPFDNCLTRRKKAVPDEKDVPRPGPNRKRKGSPWKPTKEKNQKNGG